MQQQHRAAEFTNTGGAASTQTVVGIITTVDPVGCSKAITVSNTSGVQTTGTLDVHSIAGTDNGTVTNNDTTVTIANTLIGTCHFLTSNTPIGTLTGTQKPGGAPTLDISASIPSETCGFNATWEGSYVYTGTENFNVSAS
jgi:hypothetical protein